MSNYHLSLNLEEIVNDLNAYQEHLDEVSLMIEMEVLRLDEVGGWDLLSPDLREILGYAVRFFQMTNQEIRMLLEEMRIEISNHHINLLVCLNKRAGYLQEKLERVCQVAFRPKDLAPANSSGLEDLYQEACGTAALLMESSSLADALENHIGERIDPRWDWYNS
jgi:hypothetical protein